MTLTPKEKALELKETFDGYICYAAAAVDLVLRTMDEEDNYVMYKYWQQVKQELEKL